MSRIGGVVFDAVHTILHPHPSVAEIYRAAALRQGVELDAGEIRARFGRAFRADEARDRMSPEGLTTSEAREIARWRGLVAEVLPEVPDGNRAFDELWEDFASSESWRCYGDVGEALSWLEEASIPWVIASNFDSRLRRIAAGLPELRGSERAGRFVISSEVGHRKPSRRFYAAAIERLGVPASETLWIGDDPLNDVDGPREMGARAWLLDRSGRAIEGDRIGSLGELSARLVRRN